MLNYYTKSILNEIRRAIKSKCNSWRVNLLFYFCCRLDLDLDSPVYFIDSSLFYILFYVL